MSMRSSIVYGRTTPQDGSRGFSWHGWDQIDEEDAFYLDVTGPEGSCVTIEDGEPAGSPYGFEIRMSRVLFEHIVREYAESKKSSADWIEMIEREERSYEARHGKCASCCRHGPHGEPLFKPNCKRCGGTGKAPARTPTDAEAVLLDLLKLWERGPTVDSPEAAGRAMLDAGILDAARAALKKSGAL